MSKENRNPQSNQLSRTLSEQRQQQPQQQQTRKGPADLSKSGNPRGNRDDRSKH